MPKILTHKGFKEYMGLSKEYNTDPKIKLKFSDGTSILCTSDHRFLSIDEEFKEAKTLEINDILYNDHIIIDKSIVNDDCYVYDILEVSDTHSYIANEKVNGNCVLLDEFAFLQQGLAADFFQSTYPVISSGKTTKVIIVSTPNGLNLFYKMWVDAMEKRSLYIPSEIHWSQVPGRDAKWKEETIRNTSEHNFAVEFESVSFDTLVNIDGEQVKIGDLYNELKQKNIN